MLAQLSGVTGNEYRFFAQSFASDHDGRQSRHSQRDRGVILLAQTPTGDTAMDDYLDGNPE